MESITIFLRDFGYFNAGAICGGMVIFLFAVLAFSGPMYWQQQDIKRLKNQKKSLNDRIDELEKVSDLAYKLKTNADKDAYQERQRSQLLERANEDLQSTINQLQAKNLKLYVEVDALKAQSFPVKQKIA
ncbi:MAG TPA: hypothetical protein DCX45_03490 [Acinetobacter junii]|nr:hypothetical protein [Acinetobacter junii]